MLIILSAGVRMHSVPLSYSPRRKLCSVDPSCNFDLALPSKTTLSLRTHNNLNYDHCKNITSSILTRRPHVWKSEYEGAELKYQAHSARLDTWHGDAGGSKDGDQRLVHLGRWYGDSLSVSFRMRIWVWKPETACQTVSTYISHVIPTQANLIPLSMIV